MIRNAKTIEKTMEVIDIEYENEDNPPPWRITIEDADGESVGGGAIPNNDKQVLVKKEPEDEIQSCPQDEVSIMY